MPEKIGRNEIAFTRLKSSSYNFVAQDTSGKIRHKPQELNLLNMMKSLMCYWLSHLKSGIQ
jgi:hypothetical protein